MGRRRTRPEPARPKRKRGESPKVLREGKCSALAREIAAELGLGIVEVQNLLYLGRTREELLSMTKGWK